MAISLNKIEKAYDELKNYNGDNPFIINLKRKRDRDGYRKIARSFDETRKNRRGRISPVCRGS